VTEQAISPLRRRMIADVTICKFAQKTCGRSTGFDGTVIDLLLL
jgi:hypothetical protein